MLFRLHTYFCMNNCFPFSKCLRKQARKLELKTVKCSGKSILVIQLNIRGCNSCRKFWRDPMAEEALGCKGLLGLHFYTLEDVPFSLPMWSLNPILNVTKIIFYMPTLPKGHLFLKYAHLCIKLFFSPSPTGAY